MQASGRIVVDDGARRALLESGVSLLAAGVRSIDGRFMAQDAVEIVGLDGATFAKGIVRVSSTDLAAAAGRQSGDLPEGVSSVVVHRDDLVVVP